MTLSHDRSLLAVARENKAIEIWKADTFAQLVCLPGHKNVDIRNIHWLEHQPASNKAEKDANPIYY